MKTYRAHVEAEIGDFINEKLAVDPRGRVSARDMYNAYVEWHASRPRPLEPMTETMFGRLACYLMIRRRTAAGNLYVGWRIR